MTPNVTQLTPAEEDPIVDRWLASLPELSPGGSFEDAVMARVWVPVPHWVQSVQSTTRTLLAVSITADVNRTTYSRNLVA